MIETISQIETKRIEANPNNPRTRIENVEDLVASIRENGLMQPITVRWTHKMDEDGIPTGYEVIAGSRRLTAFKELGIEKIACIVKNDVDDAKAFELATTENIVRENMSAVDEAKAVAKLFESGKDRVEIAAMFGKSPRWAEGRRRIANIGDKAMKLLEEGKITLGHADVLSMCCENNIERWLDAAKWNSPEQLKAKIMDEDRKDLTKAPFNWKKLCAKCPNRSDCQSDLFGDVKEVYCLDLNCFESRKADECVRLREEFKKADYEEVPENEKWDAERSVRFNWTDKYICITDPNDPEESENQDRVKAMREKGVKARFYIDEKCAEGHLMWRLKDDPDYNEPEADEDDDYEDDPEDKVLEDLDYSQKNEVRENANKLEKELIEYKVHTILSGLSQEAVALILTAKTNYQIKFQEADEDGEVNDIVKYPLEDINEDVCASIGNPIDQRTALKQNIIDSLVRYSGVDEDLREFFELEPREKILQIAKEEFLDKKSDEIKSTSDYEEEEE